MIFAFRRNLVLAASAGTGKTHSLVGVLVHLLLGASELGAARPGALHAPVDPARVVATTFSRKAAAEIRTRLTRELELLAASSGEAKYRADLDRASSAGGVVWSDAEVAARARRALDRLPLAQIGTLHGFAGALVKSHALELALSPGFEIEPEDEGRARVEEAIERALGDHAERDPDAVRDLARSAGGVERLVQELASVLARAEEENGAGALSVPERDAVDLEALMRDTVEWARVLSFDARCAPAARAFSAAWREHERAVREGRGEGADADAGIEALVDAARDLFGQNRRGQSEAAQGFFEFRDDRERLDVGGDTHRDRGEQLVRAWHARHLFGARTRSARELLVECEREVRRARQRASALGFGDVLRSARDLLRDHPSVAAEVGEGIDALLVDEFQDTSRLQLDLVRLLWERSPRERSAGVVPAIAAMRGHGLFVVGDRKQSIYGFRGADVGVFAELCIGIAGWRAREALGVPPDAGVQEPDRPLGDFVPLRHNRRSVEPVLRFANAFSRKRLAGGGAGLFDVTYVPETEDLLPPPEAVAAATTDTGATGASGPAVTWLRLPTNERGRTTRLQEAQAIAERAHRMVTVDGVARWRDVAVLAHTNEMLEAAAYALAQRGVPYVVAGRGFYSAREVRDVMALLTLVVRPRDKLALLEVLRGPWAGVSDATLLRLVEPGRGLLPFETILARGTLDEIARDAATPEGAAEAARVKRVLEVVARLRRDVDRVPAAALLAEAARELALAEALVQLPRGAQRVANVEKLLAIAERETRAPALLARLVRAADRAGGETEAATFSDEDDAVRLLTVHASKGLDFAVVFVPEVGSDGRRAEGACLLLAREDDRVELRLRLADARGSKIEPPSYQRAKRIARARDRAERARLAYVAVTRAARALWFVGDRRPPKEESEAFRATIACTLQSLAEEDPMQLLLRVETPPPSAAPPAPSPSPPREAIVPVAAGPAPAASRSPAWRRLPIATTSLQDFHHCPRRFQLVHLLDLPERDLPPLAASTTERPPEDEPRATAADPRAEGTLAHKVLERVPLAAFGAPATEAAAACAAVLEREGYGPDAPPSPRVVRAATRFLAGAYASELAARGATVLREHPFSVTAADDRGRTLALRGTIDLLVRWPDGAVDVVDYKRARGPSPEPYAFQLDVYALAAADAFAEPATRVRSGILFLGGDPSKPRWRTQEHDAASAHATRDRLVALAARLVEARWAERFPRVAKTTCKTIRCGYVSLCHPAARAEQLGLFGG